LKIRKGYHALYEKDITPFHEKDITPESQIDDKGITREHQIDEALPREPSTAWCKKLRHIHSFP
jgi:hypothetical protein